MGNPRGYPAPGGYRPQVDPQISQWFYAVDTDRSGQITFNELQQALVNGNWSRFSEEACRMFIEMFDQDRKGSINLVEFASLFDNFNQWKRTFESYDQDRSGYIEYTELMQVFQQMGYRFSSQFVQNLLAKYDPSRRRLTLDKFIVVCVQIQKLTNSFKTRDPQMRGQATFGYEDFLGIALGAHN